MGSVYEAHHEVLGVNVALKFLHSELSEEFNLKERFLQEARVSATIQSPHIVRVMDVDVFGDQPYLVMDLLKGEPLQRRIATQGRLTIGKTLDFASQILVGLQEAHDKHIVHRDLKPDNVFITRGQHGEELLKILDFGIAKLRQAAGEKGNLTQPGAVMGTPEYMAPEQAYSADQVDARSDVYSVGVMIFEMLSGKRPVEGETPQEIAHKILMGDVLRLEEVAPEVPPGLVRVVHTAMEPRPEDRWADARDLREALLPFVSANPFATTGLAAAPTGHGATPFIAVSKTPRIDGGKTSNASDRPPTRVDGANKQSFAAASRAASAHAGAPHAVGSHAAGAHAVAAFPAVPGRQEPPLSAAHERVPATIPPSAGPPRASALPPTPTTDPVLAAVPTTDPALAPTIPRTADMPQMPDLRSSGVGSTVNLPPAAPVGPAVPVRRATVVRRSHGSSWPLFMALAVLLLGGGGAIGYYYYESVYNAPVPPPRPVRRVYTQTPAATPGAAAAEEADGPTVVEPLDPGALEPVGQVPQLSPSPRPAPQAGGGVTPSNSGTGQSGVPVFTLPTAIPLATGNLPINIPTALPPISLPTGFSIPGLTPPPAPAPNSN